jgi:hypothetical protein
MRHRRGGKNSDKNGGESNRQGARGGTNGAHRVNLREGFL